MKVSHECIMKGKSEVETGNDHIYLDKDEKKIVHDALNEYVKNHKRKIKAKKLLTEMDMMFGY